MAKDTLAGITLGNTQDDNVIKKANMNIYRQAFQDADKAYANDTVGPTKTITSTYTYSGTVAEQKTHIDSLEALIDGNQSNTVQFVSDLRGTLNVKVEAVESGKVAGDPRKIKYTLTLFIAKPRNT